MFTTYFKRPTTRAIYYTGSAGPYLDEFTDWLEQRGYRHDTIRHRLQGAARFSTWIQSTGDNLQSVSADTLDKFRHHLSAYGQLHIGAGPFSVCWLGAQLFFEFLQAHRNVTAADVESQTAQPPLLQAFEQ